jgi:hypothetical protein
MIRLAKQVWERAAEAETSQFPNPAMRITRFTLEKSPKRLALSFPYRNINRDLTFSGGSRGFNSNSASTIIQDFVPPCRLRSFRRNLLRSSVMLSYEVLRVCSAATLVALISFSKVSARGLRKCSMNAYRVCICQAVPLSSNLRWVGSDSSGARREVSNYPWVD